MVFSSALFVFYFLPITLFFYYLVDYRSKNKVLLLASLLFYAYCAPVFIFVVVATIAVDYFVAQKIHRLLSTKPKSSLLENPKLYLAISIILNVALLGYYKYADFVIEIINTFLSLGGVANIAELNLLLPVGISFFTFQKITYVVDVYRKNAKPQQSYADLLLYTLLFPQMIAGPIIRYREIQTQLTHRRLRINRLNFINGFILFSVGMAKKVAIANVLAKPVDVFFKLDPSSFGFEIILLVMLCYTMQIYFDFAGYSDMAIGIGLMLGFRFPQNFNFPYISQSISEFWRRWHITLGRFMKDYLYIPLGGNRATKARTYFNLWLVFLLSGLWHGASFTFIVWGVWHGCFLVVERIFSQIFSTNKEGRPFGKLVTILRVGVTFYLVMLGWIFFRADSLEQAWPLFKTLLGAGMLDTQFSLNLSKIAFSEIQLSVLSVALFFALAGISKKYQSFIQIFLSYRRQKGSLTRVLVMTCVLLFWFYCLGEILGLGYNPFIYFRF